MGVITSNAGAALSRCWPTPIGALASGAFGDVTVLRSSGTGDVWTQIVNARERDVLLVVVGGKPRYGESSLMTSAGAGPATTLTVDGIKRRLAIPDPRDPSKAWRWTDIVARLNAVRKDPAKALAHAQERRRAYAGPMNAREAPRSSPIFTGAASTAALDGLAAFYK